MLKKEQKTYQLFNNYCVRTPLFPISFQNNFRIISDKELKGVVLNPVFREALYLASPELFNQIVKWEKGKIKANKKIEKLQFAILKYLIRISARCTPFGLFASCGVGEFGLETTIQLNKKQNYKRATRFDTTFLNQLFQELLKNKIIRENVLFYSNTSIYKIGEHYRYVEYSLEKKRRSYSLEGLVYSEYLETILKEAKNGKTVLELSNLLVDDEITKEEAIGFIEDLIDNQILVSELEITVTGEDYFKSLITRIQQIPEASTIQKQLSNLQQQLHHLDLKIGNQTDDYKEIIFNAKSLVPDLDIKYLFQTDTFTSFKSNTLNKDIKKQLKKAFILFNKMTLPTANKNIEQFKRDFLKRFKQSEVSLNLALDTETGIGYGDKREDSNNLLEGLVSIGNNKRYKHVIWTDVDTILQKKLVNVTQNRAYTISLTEKDFKELPTSWHDLPETLSSIIEIYKIKNKETIFIKNIGGASATYLLGRFGQCNKEISETIHKIAKVEETINSDKILAEIIHLPEARTGNILQRPSFREYEIPYLGKSSVLPEYQISIEDILVSVKNDTIILRSKKLDKEILPRLGNAHNYSGNPFTYLSIFV
ncbi:lantibiotic dehydratase family protein [Polaribacter batillariae]|uniref:Lantibiotic dehydratase family protein n=1 Tax=Polaribacter batillariae TaxID=2808900 RepID=A0ABX7STD8_9FLAO|nr:lantibiotic dehydratase family protein [Polaribacter batillariae]QTD36728.1 lantibiotic dehydratase family protein [Polaribacter batillariae]